MSFLPIVDRELRIRSRSPAAFRLRLGAALVSILLVAALLLSTQLLFSPDKVGGFLFVCLGGLAFIYCLIEGPRTTADCLSREKRQGTLGLLFLTELRGYDVVLGKLMAHSLDGFYRLLAIFPPLAVTFTMGGITGSEFWRLVLVLVNTLWFSLTASLVISALTRSQRRAWAASLLLVGAVVLLPILTPAAWADPLGAAWQFSPLQAWRSMFEQTYLLNPRRFWNSLFGLHFLSWLFVLFASLYLPRSVREGGARRVARPIRTNTVARRFKPDARSSEVRRRLLEIHPVAWLAEVGDHQRFLLWFLILTVTVAAVAIWKVMGVFSPVAVSLFAGALGLHFFLACWIAAQSCRALGQAKEDGTLEMLLTTPITDTEIVRGHLMALKRLFFLPIAILVSVESVLFLATLFVLSDHQSTLLGEVVSDAYLAGWLVVSILDMVAAAWFGLWMGLREKSVMTATTKTIVYLLILPTLAGMCGLITMLGWPLLGLVKDLLFIQFSREKLRSRFRALATREFDLPASSRPARERNT